MRIHRSAREDRWRWLEAGLEERHWSPIKRMSKKRAPPAVTFSRSDGAEMGTRQPAQVYAEYLERDHWGGEGPDRRVAALGTEPVVAGQAQVESGAIAAEELGAACPLPTDTVQALNNNSNNKTRHDTTRHDMT